VGRDQHPAGRPRPTWTITLIGTGLMREPHTVRVEGTVVASTPEQAVDILVGLIARTGTWRVEDENGDAIVVDGEG
jgi:hypothetical protein